MLVCLRGAQVIPEMKEGIQRRAAQFRAKRDMDEERQRRIQEHAEMEAQLREDARQIAIEMQEQERHERIAVRHSAPVRI